MYVCFIKKPIELYHFTTYFAIFLNFPPDFHQRNGDSRSCACCKVYGVDKLINNWNLYKESTRPKLILYLPTFEKYGRTYFVMIGNNVHVSIFV